MHDEQHPAKEEAMCKKVDGFALSFETQMTLIDKVADDVDSMAWLQSDLKAFLSNHKLERGAVTSVFKTAFLNQSS